MNQIKDVYGVVLYLKNVIYRDTGGAENLSQLFYSILILIYLSMHNVTSVVNAGRGMLHQYLPHPKNPDFVADIFSYSCYANIFALSFYTSNLD